MINGDQVGWHTPTTGQGAATTGLPDVLKVVRYEIADNGVATVTLNRPERRNSWTARMNVEYRAVLHALDTDPAVRVVVVTGAGNSFCVGADSRALSGYVGTTSYDTGLPLDAATPGHGVRAEFDADMVWQYGLRVPVIAAVNGACAGVAVALAAFSDIRFAVTGAKVTTASPRLGLPAEYGLSWILPRLMGVTHAADLLISGRVVTSDFLAETGFFNAVHPREEFDGAVRAYAEQVAAASPQAVTLAKRQLCTDLLHSDPAASVRLSKDLTGQMMTTADYREGVAALVEKRAPVFGTA